MLSVRWYLRFGLSYRDVEELLAERGIDVDHVTVFRWVQRFTPILVGAARPARHSVGDRWHVDETYLKVAGTWRTCTGPSTSSAVVDVLLSTKRDAQAARRFFTKAMAGTQTEPAEVVTDRAPAYLGVLDELLPAALHEVDQYANNKVEADHGRLKARLRPMPGLKTVASAQRVCLGHAFIQNLRRGHYELGMEAPAERRLLEAFAELALVM